MLGLKLNHVSKSGHRCPFTMQFDESQRLGEVPEMILFHYLCAHFDMKTYEFVWNEWNQNMGTGSHLLCASKSFPNLRMIKRVCPLIRPLKSLKLAARNHFVKLNETHWIVHSQHFYIRTDSVGMIRNVNIAHGSVHFAQPVVTERNLHKEPPPLVSDSWVGKKLNII